MASQNCNYPLFVPPLELAKKPRKEWSAKESILYKEWLLGSSDMRIECLCQKSGLLDAGDPAEVIDQFGSFVAESLKVSASCSDETSELKLSNLDLALCADMGLLVAKKLLQSREENLRWEVIRKPKSAFSYNLPVIFGFENGTYLDPIGGSISEGRSVLRGKKTYTVWREMFEYWRSLSGS